MSTVHITAQGSTHVSAGFMTAAVRSDVEVKKIVRKYGQLLNTRIKAKASGRPGPNAPTGDYRRSWTTVYFDGPGVYNALVGTNKPQGRRLEYGFVGTDSLGRVYNQPPYPHVGPATEEIRPDFENELYHNGPGL